MALPHRFVQSNQQLAAGSTRSVGREPLSPHSLAVSLTAEAIATLRELFGQIEQSLTVLRGLAGIMLVGSAAVPTGQSLRVWLHPNARQAEAAVHQLRDQGLLSSPALTELSQNLTVLVLAADMLVQGQLSSLDTLVFYELLQRNAESAIGALAQLRALAGLAPQ